MAGAVLLAALPLALDAHALETSPFTHSFSDVKFLDAYFGTASEKQEAGPGDRNVPLTVVLANVGTEDITGIRGQLGLTQHFSSSADSGILVYADADANAAAGENFALTFFVDIDGNAEIRLYPGTVKVDYSRLRESGTRTSFFEFDFKVTGDSIINLRAAEPFLTSIRQNNITVEISNDGTAPVSDVELELQNTQTAISSTSTSITNVEKVVISDSNWHVGNIEPGQTRTIGFSVYVPESVRAESLRAPMAVTYTNAHGDLKTVHRIVDLFVRGLVDLTVYDVRVRDISGSALITGEVINEGNVDALFGFVTVGPGPGSNLAESRQFIGDIETDSPVPFNVPVEFDGEPRYGEHDIEVTVRYKDDLRTELFQTHNATIVLEPPAREPSSGIAFLQQDGSGAGQGGPADDLPVYAVAAGIVSAVVAILALRRRRRAAV